MLGTNVRDYVHGESLGPYLQALESVFAGGEASEIEIQARSPEGDVWFLTSIGPLRSGGRIIAAVITAIDITDRRQDQQERQLLLAERTNLLERLQMQIARMPVAYMVFDEQFHICEVNRAAGDMLWSTRPDTFCFAHRMLQGDGQIIARITATGARSTGVMMRDSADPNALFSAVEKWRIRLRSQNDGPMGELNAS